MCAPMCPDMAFPFATVTMTVPPPIILPTSPCPVKPLRLPCPAPCEEECPPMLEKYDRMDNYYNNFNQDYHAQSKNLCPPRCRNCCGPPKKCPCPKICEDYMEKKKPFKNPGCPRGFKPCSIVLTPPPNCDPCGVWCAQVDRCPPKPKHHSCFYQPRTCRRPCCKHVKEPCCMYDQPCKAHCYIVKPNPNPCFK